MILQCWNESRSVCGKGQFSSGTAPNPRLAIAAFTHPTEEELNTFMYLRGHTRSLRSFSLFSMSLLWSPRPTLSKQTAGGRAAGTYAELCSLYDGHFRACSGRVGGAHAVGEELITFMRAYAGIFYTTLPSCTVEQCLSCGRRSPCCLNKQRVAGQRAPMQSCAACMMATFVLAP